jgi:hypothetical protein
MHLKGPHTLAIPEIATAVFAFLDNASLLAAALTRRSWAPAALDALWRAPCSSAMLAAESIPEHRRFGYAAAVRALRLMDPEAAEAAVHHWTFPSLQLLLLPCAVVQSSPLACRAFVARCGGATLRRVAFIEGAPGDSKHWRQSDGRYDVCLADMLADLSLRDGLTELYIGTAVTEKLQVAAIAPPTTSHSVGSEGFPSVAGSHYGNSGSSHDDASGSSTISASTYASAPPCLFRHLRRFRIVIAISSGLDEAAPLPPVAFLRPELLGRVTELNLDAEAAGSAPGSVVEAVGSLRALCSLILKLPCACRITVAQAMALGNLTALRNLSVGCAQWDVGIRHFPDADWARLTAGWPRLQTLTMKSWWGLTGERALRILGAACRELVELRLWSFDGHLGGLSASGEVLVTNDSALDASAAAAYSCVQSRAYSDAHGSPYDAQRAVVFPKLKALMLHSTGLEVDGTRRTWWSDETMTSAPNWGHYHVEEEPGTPARARALAARLMREAPNLRQFRFVDITTLEGMMGEHMAATGGIRVCPWLGSSEGHDYRRWNILTGRETPTAIEKILTASEALGQLGQSTTY